MFHQFIWKHLKLCSMINRSFIIERVIIRKKRKRKTETGAIHLKKRNLLGNFLSERTLRYCQSCTEESIARVIYRRLSSLYHPKLSYLSWLKLTSLTNMRIKMCTPLVPFQFNFVFIDQHGKKGGGGRKAYVTIFQWAQAEMSLIAPISLKS